MDLKFNEIKKRKRTPMGEEGFIVADFLFSFILILGCGMVVFALTFSLMTIEVGQYITWSAARSYSGAAINKDESVTAAQEKFQKLSAQFPLLTGSSTSSWFELKIGNVGADARPQSLQDADQKNSLGGESRHPWSGVSATLDLKLFKGLKIPFLGRIARDGDTFKMDLSAFLLRNPSQQECLDFTKNKFRDGILQMNDGQMGQGYLGQGANMYVPVEDNGC